MTYICPYCHHEQGEKTLCSKCEFDLSSNHYNPVCSKCEIKFTSLEDLKVHFKNCKKEKSDLYGKCMQCEMSFNSEKMFNIHFIDFHGEKTKAPDKENESNYVHEGKCKRFENKIEKKTICPVCKIDFSCYISFNLKEHLLSCKKLNLWQCKNCLQIFTEHLIYEEHTRKKECQDKEFRCIKCKIKFASNFTKQKHILYNSCENENYPKCYFENCNVRCIRRVQLNEHVKEYHGVDLKYEMKKFPSFGHFNLWKDEFGMKSSTYYSIMARSKYLTCGQEVESITYGCTFDLQQAACNRYKTDDRANKKRKVKFDFSDSVCTARIHVKILSNKQVYARICGEHNHPLTVEHIKVLRLPKSRRDFLLNAFIIGASVEEVMELIHEESKSLNIVTKESTLPRRFFKEIQRKSLLRHGAGNDMQAVAQFVADLRIVEGALIFNHESVAFNVTEKLPDGKFMLGFQTQQMLQILDLYGQVVYIEGLHNLVRYPDYKLFNFLVRDETNTIFPVAHFITNALAPEHLTLMFSTLKPRVRHINVESIVVQSDQHLDVALASVFNNKTIFINQWDLSCIDQPRKRCKGSESFEYAVLVNSNQEEEEEEMSEEQLDCLTERTVTAADDCVMEFHRVMRSKFKRSHTMFILLIELTTYFKKRFSSKFNVTLEDNFMTRLLRQMRKQLFEYIVEDLTEDQELNMFHDTQIKEEDEEDEDNEMLRVVKSESISDDNTGDNDLDEEMEESKMDTSCSRSVLDLTDNKEILKEIIVANKSAAEDESAIHLLQEYQKSIVELLMKNPIGRPLIIQSVLEETKALYEQVVACCNETTNLGLLPKGKSSL